MKVTNRLTGKEVDLPEAKIKALIAKGVPLEGKGKVDKPNVLKSDRQVFLESQKREQLDVIASDLDLVPTEYKNAGLLISAILEKEK